MTAVARIRVLLADDQALIRLGFRMLLSSAPDIELVGEAETGSFAVDLTAALHPDVVLMDVRMPGMDGIEATRRIVSGTPHSRVLILTTFDLPRLEPGRAVRVWSGSVPGGFSRWPRTAPGGRRSPGSTVPPRPRPAPAVLAGSTDRPTVTAR